MTIEPNNDGWSFDSSGAWKLVYSDKIVIFFGESTGISTQATLFIGTKEECEAEASRLELVLPSDQEASEEQDTVISDPGTDPL